MLVSATTAFHTSCSNAINSKNISGRALTHRGRSSLNLPVHNPTSYIHVNLRVVPQLQGAVEAEFQEKFQRLPGEIRDFLQDRKLEVRGHSKSRPSTPHEALSEED